MLNPSIVLIDNYDSFTYNLFQWVQAQTDWRVHVFRNDEISFEKLRALKPAGVILSPGPGHPGNPKDFGLCRDVILERKSLGCPLLGVCLGHQGIALHLGGQVQPAPAVVHGKTSQITQTKKSALFDGLPENLEVMRYHSWLVGWDNFPDELEVTAIEPKENLIMGFEHKTDPLYGVQFHPESIGTPQGKQLLGNFLRVCEAKNLGSKNAILEKV